MGGPWAAQRGLRASGMGVFRGVSVKCRQVIPMTLAQNSGADGTKMLKLGF